MIQFPNSNMSVVESQIVERLVSDILSAGLTVSVYDGGDYCLKHCTSLEAIIEALASTDEDELVLHQPKNAQGLRMRVGWLRLVWGNDTAVISDYTVNLEPQVRGASALADHIDALEAGTRKPFAPNTIARFWVNLAGGNTVLVKLRKDQELTHCEGGQTDEGFDYIARTWRFDGEKVNLCWQNNACDCDGPISRSGSSYCTLPELQQGYHCPDHEPRIVFPKWRETRAEQRDYNAEAAGY